MAAPGCWAGALPRSPSLQNFPRVGLRVYRLCPHVMRYERVCERVDVCSLCVLRCITVGRRMGTHV